MRERTATGRYRTSLLGCALAGLSLALGACTLTGSEQVVTASVPDDYRLRHPIAIEEGKQSIVVFVGQGRGGPAPEIVHAGHGGAAAGQLQVDDGTGSRLHAVYAVSLPPGRGWVPAFEASWAS